MAAKAGLCDVCAQKYAQPEVELEWLRIGKFMVFCVGYVGSFQHVLFNRVYPRLFTASSSFVAAVQMALFDNFVHSPCLYLPCYYSFKSLVEGDSVAKGLQQYSQDGFSVLTACWGIWIPAQLLNFWLVPKNFRILYIAVTGSVWEVVLSYLAPMTAEAPEAPTPSIDGSQCTH